jgi:flagellar motor switch protein FliN
MSEMLTQNEIDEMMQTGAGNPPAQDHVSPESSALTPMESDTLGEIGNISMGAAATALYAILGRQVNITTPDVRVMTLEQLSQGQTLPLVVVDIGYTEGFAGNSLFILRMEDVKVITDIMMGGDGNPGDEELSELHISAISEAMNQMMGGMATSMAEMFNRIVSISPPRSLIAKLSDEEIHTLINRDHGDLIRVKFKIEIEGLLNSSITQLIPIDFGRQLVAELTSPAPAASPDPVFPADSAIAAAMGGARPKTVHGGSAPVPAAKPYPARSPARQKPVDVRPIQLASFDEPEYAPGPGSDAGLDMILDVPLQITVELGQCRKPIKEILDLNIGSIITLDKLPGEPVDVVVNGKTVAKGEVIVIDDNYGIRVTEVLTSASRVRAAR